MTEVTGVRFRTAGKAYDFDTAGIALAIGDFVIVDTSRGHELGQVVSAPVPLPEGADAKNLKPVVRKATEEDIQKLAAMRSREREALDECEKLAARLGLGMKMISAEFSYDGSRLTIYFGAEDRVDFRELVRELGRKMKARVEMRQVGPRDEAKMIGGYGRCGRQLCCAGFLCEFNPVSIKMAKEQDLPLNPMKISGVCGRLLCCLGYECEQYRQMKAGMPPNGERVNTPTGEGVIVGSNPLKETVRVELESGARIDLPVKDLNPEKKPLPEKQPQPERRDTRGRRRR